MNCQIERWILIEGYDNYIVSNFGNVKNIKTERILKPCLVGDGYHAVNLSKKGIVEKKTIHRIVANEFINNFDDVPCIDHIDRNRTNNDVSNLRWVTYRQNNRNRSRHGKINHHGISFDKRNNCYIAAINDDEGCKKQKSYAIKRYGNNKALELAVLWRTSKENIYSDYL